MLQKNDLMIERYSVEQHEMLMQLPHIADVRHDRDAKFSAEQTDRQELTDARHPDRIHLDETRATGLEVILENDPIWHVLTERKFRRGDSLGDLLVPDDVVRMSGLFDPKRIHRLKPFADREGLGNGPLLIGIEHDPGLSASDLADNAGSAKVALRIGRAHL